MLVLKKLLKNKKNHSLIEKEGIESNIILKSNINPVVGHIAANTAVRFLGSILAISRLISKALASSS